MFQIVLRNNIATHTPHACKTWPGMEWREQKKCYIEIYWGYHLSVYKQTNLHSTQTRFSPFACDCGRRLNVVIRFRFHPKNNNEKWDSAADIIIKTHIFRCKKKTERAKQSRCYDFVEARQRYTETQLRHLCTMHIIKICWFRTEIMQQKLYLNSPHIRLRIEWIVARGIQLFLR